MMSIVSSRYDIARFGMERFSSSPRQADLLIVSGRVTHKMAAPLRQVYDQMLEPKWVIAMGACASSGGMFNNYTVLQGVDKIVRWTSTSPAARPPGGADGGNRPPPREDPCRRAARVRDPWGRGMTGAVPGLVETIEAHGETTLVVDPARIVEACTHLRDAEGFNVLVDLSGVDYLGWASTDVAGYIGTHGPRPELSQGPAIPKPKAKRFTVVPPPPPRRRARAPARGGVARRRRGDRLGRGRGRRPTGTSARRTTSSGSSSAGHPNLVRILMPDDWEGPAPQGLPARRRAGPLLGEA